MQKNPKIERFISILLKPIRDRELRETTRLEIEDHLLTSIESLEGGILTYDLATEVSLLKMGDPNELGRKIVKANRPWFLNIWLGSFALLLLMLGILIANSEWKTHLALARNSVDAAFEDKRIWKTYLADRDILATEEFFKFKDRTSDAGIFLNDKVAWDGPNGDNITELSLPFKILKVLEGPSALEGVTARESWLNQEQNLELAKLDFSWFSELEKFDSWNIFSSQHLNHQDSPANPTTVRLPRYSELVMWAKARLLWGRHQGKILPALKEVRKLSQLIYTNDTLVSQVISLHLLKLESEFIQHTQITKGVRIDWKVFSAEELNRARRFFWATPGYLSSASVSNEKTLELLNAAEPVGICAALNETAVEIWIAGAADEVRQEHFKIVKEKLKDFKTKCHLDMVVLALEAPSDLDFYGRGEGLERFLSYANLIPIIRKNSALQTLRFAAPNYFAQYASLLE